MSFDVVVDDGSSSSNKKKRLVFDDSHHCGRTKELSILVDAYGRLIESNNGKPQEIVFVKGFSGSGKSTVVSEFRKTISTVESKKNKNFSEECGCCCYFVSGKYDESVQQDPFAAIFRALEMLCHQIIQSNDDNENDDELDRIRAQIPDSTIQELQVLTASVPQLAAVIGGGFSTNNTQAITDTATSAAVAGAAPVSTTIKATQLNYLFVKFLQCVSTKERPVILFLDDIQWLNRPSLDLLQLLVTDAKISYFMFVGCYRQEEVEKEVVDDNDDNDEDNNVKQQQQHILYELFTKLKDCDKPCTTIHVKDLPLEDVCDFLARVLDISKHEIVMPLAEVLYHKTQGNIFFIKSYLQLLVEKELLTFSYIDYAWTWGKDLQDLEQELDLSDNVVAVVMAKLKGLDESLRTLMILASSLPSTFESSILFTLLGRCGKDSTNLEQRLDILVKEGLLVNVIGSTRYSFAHDRIQQASMDILTMNDDDEDETKQQEQKLNQTVGEVLADVALSNDAEDWMIFAAIDRLESCGYDHRDKMIQYYSIAGKRSAIIAAYGPAALYYGKAISLLRSIDKEHEDEDGRLGSSLIWQSRHEQCLDLFLAAIDVEFTIGNYESGNDYCQELLSHSTSESHILRTYWFQSKALAKQQQSIPALEKVKAILYTIGEYPRNAGNPFDMIIRFMRTKSRLKTIPASDILNLQLVTESNILFAMEALESLIMICADVGKNILALQGTLRMLNLTFEHGMTPQSATAFILFAMINYKVFGDEKFGNKMKEIAVALFEKVPGSSAIVTVVAASDVDVWYVPINDLRGRFDNAFEYAMSSGDCFGGMLGFGMNVCVAFSCGLPLSICCVESKIFLNMLRQYNVEQLHVMFEPFDDLLLCLTGEMDPALWAREFDIPNKKRADKNLVTEIVQGCLNRFMGAYYFRNFDQAERFLEGFRNYADYGGAYLEVMADTFFGPLISMARYRQTNRRKYRRRSNKEYKKLEKMIQQRGLNIIHKFHIVDAEFSATFGSKTTANNQDDTKSKFEKAIAMCRKAGFMQDASLASELAGEYFLRIDDSFWARHYLNQAVRLYQEWGAKGKVRHLIESHSSFIDETELDVTEMKTTRKPRFSLAARMDIGSSVLTASRRDTGTSVKSRSESSLKAGDTLSVISSIL